MTGGDEPGSGAVPMTPLPESVRREVVALTVEALGALEPDQVPAALRRIREFTPAKRSRLGATALASTVAADAAFRARVFEEVRRRHPDLAAAACGDGPLTVDPAPAAAVAYLCGAGSLPALAAAARQEEERRARERAGAAADAEIARLRAEIEIVRDAGARALRAAQDEAAAVRGQLDDLRRRTRRNGERLRRAEQEAAAAAAELEQERSGAAAARDAAAAEQKRLRGRVAQLETALEVARRGVREARAVDDVRLGTLLDVLTSVSAAIRRELALPPTAGSPAEMVAAALAAGAADPLAQVESGGVPYDAPALLDRVLVLPGVHLIVDGYNVTKSGYGTLSLEAQRARLLAGLGALAARYPAVEVTLRLRRRRGAGSARWPFPRPGACACCSARSVRSPTR